jgi:hypothetical protein
MKGTLAFVAFATFLPLHVEAQTDVDDADGAPPGMVAFFDAVTCPPGWTTLPETQGRLLLVVADGAQVGKAIGAPLLDQEDRTHNHTFSATFELGSKSISAAGWPHWAANHEAGEKGSHQASGTTSSSTSGLPFAQFLLCQKSTKGAGKVKLKIKTKPQGN